MKFFGATRFIDLQITNTPVGEPCARCSLPIASDDSGYSVPFVSGEPVLTQDERGRPVYVGDVSLRAYHRACFHRAMGVR